MAEPVSLRQAIRSGVLEVPKGSKPERYLEVVRKARTRDRWFPEARGRTPKREALYDPDELTAWQHRRPGSGVSSPALEETAPRVAPTRAPPPPTSPPALNPLSEWWDSVAAEHAAAPSELRRGIREIAEAADGGRDCPRCGRPMRWAGGYTALVCIAGECRTWVRDSAALERAARHRARTMPKQASGPLPAEVAEVGEERAVALDGLAEVRELLGLIPRGDGWRDDAVRALHKLEQLEARYKDARGYNDVDAAHELAEALIGELADVLAYARKLRRSRERGSRGSLLRFGRRGGGDDEYEYDDGDGDSGQAPEADSGAPAPVPGYVPPDPAWAAHNRESADGWWAAYDAHAAAAARTLIPQQNGARH